MRSTILREFAGRTNVFVKLKLSELIRIAFSYTAQSFARGVDYLMDSFPRWS